MGQECYRNVNATGAAAFLHKWHNMPKLDWAPAPLSDGILGCYAV
jgi:hypothetical protein